MHPIMQSLHTIYTGPTCSPESRFESGSQSTCLILDLNPDWPHVNAVPQYWVPIPVPQYWVAIPVPQYWVPIHVPVPQYWVPIPVPQYWVPIHVPQYWVPIPESQYWVSIQSVLYWTPYLSIQREAGSKVWGGNMSVTLLVSLGNIISVHACIGTQYLAL